MKAKHYPSDKNLCSQLIPAKIVGDIAEAMRDRLAKIKQNRCLAIWKKIKGGREDDEKLEINDGLWSAVRKTFDEKLSCSLIKFLSSFICQTGSFELSRSFFLFNLSAACDQKKFFLQESLLE